MLLIICGILRDYCRVFRIWKNPYKTPETGRFSIARCRLYGLWAIATVLTTFDVHYDRQASLEIYGTKGSLRVPDPNCFGGSVWLLRPEDGSFKEMPLLFDYKENSRGIGVADMAKALREKSSFP